MTAALSPDFLYNLESNMRVVSATSYQSLNENTWWRKVAKEMPSASKKERILWLLDTAKIRSTDYPGGDVSFDDLVILTTEYENKNASAGLKLKKEQLEDLDQGGIQLAAEWARQIGAYSAYWPQKQIAAAIRAGESATTYDGQTFFNASAHPYNPKDTSKGTFGNMFTGAASGLYPGALDISTTVTVDQAINNVAKAMAYITSIKQPNGEDPRNLRIASLIVPPALEARAQQITNARFIAQAAGSAAGSGDVEAIVRNFGFGDVIVAPELGSPYGGSDTEWYIATQDITSNQLGALTYVNREPFSIVYHGPQTDADLARRREFQWTTEGRNVVGYGHPFLLFKCKAS